MKCGSADWTNHDYVRSPKRARAYQEGVCATAHGHVSLRTECVRQIEQAREPCDILRAMEDLTPGVLHEWPELLPLLARQVLPACRDNPDALERAVAFCCPRRTDACGNAQPHPMGDAAEEILLAWIREAGELAPPSAGRLLHCIEAHLLDEPGLVAAKWACAGALQGLRQRVHNMPDEVRLLIARYLDPDKDPLQREPNPLVLARKRHKAYLSCASVNKAFYRILTPLLKEAWVAWVCAHIDHDAGRYAPGAQRDLNDCLNVASVERQLAIWGESMWLDVFRLARAPIRNSEAQRSLLVALFKDRAPKRVLQALTPLLDSVMRGLHDERTGPELREDLIRWLADLLALAYQKWVAPDHADFTQLIGLVFESTRQLAPAERFDLLLELAALSIDLESLSLAVASAIDELRSTVRADWPLIDDCLRLVRGEGGDMPCERVRAVLKHLLLDTLTERGAAFARAFSAAARLPAREGFDDLLMLGLHDLMRDAALLEEGESPPRVRELVFELFRPGDMVDALHLDTMEDSVLLSCLVQPPTWEALALLKAVTARQDLSPSAAMQALVHSMAACTEEAELKDALLAFVETIRPVTTDEAAQ